MTWTKIDDAIADDDATAPTVLPYALRRNTAALVEDRHMGCSICYDVDAPIVMSSHPHHWSSIPILLPVTAGASTVEANVNVTVSNEEVSFALRVEGQQSSTVVLAPSASPQWTGAMSVAVPRVATGAYWRAELLVMSSAYNDLLGAVATANVAEVLTAGRSLHMEQTGGAVYTAAPTKCHFALKFATQEQGAGVRESLHHVRYIDTWRTTTDEFQIWIWPPLSESLTSSNENTKPDSCNAYLLGTAEIHSIGLQYAGDSGVVTVGQATATEPGQPIRSSHITRQYDVLDTLRRDRRLWWAASLRTTVTGSGISQIRSRYHEIGAFVTSSASDIAGALVERRADSIGVRVGLLVASLKDDGGTTITIDIDGTTSDVDAYPALVNDNTAGSPQIAYNALQNGDEWGSVDSGGADDVHLLTLVDAVVPWPSGVAVGDVVPLSVSAVTVGRSVGDRAVVRFYTACITEEF